MLTDRWSAWAYIDTNQPIPRPKATFVIIFMALFRWIFLGYKLYNRSWIRFDAGSSVSFDVVAFVFLVSANAYVFNSSNTDRNCYRNHFLFSLCDWFKWKILDRLSNSNEKRWCPRKFYGMLHSSFAYEWNENIRQNFYYYFIGVASHRIAMMFVNIFLPFILNVFIDRNDGNWTSLRMSLFSDQSVSLLKYIFM